jgi:SAM-dependent MidA family methyltransferase
MNETVATLPLSEIIKKKICKEGPLSFRDFMEMSLYHPQTGYYSSASDKIGKCGDYYTSPYLTNVFGDMIAKQLEEMWLLLGKKEFTVVEYGAGMGSLCRDILKRIKSCNAELYDKINYCIIEKSAAMREKEKKILTEKVKWYNSISEIGEICGCVLANEVVDNFSVHQVVMKKEMMEVFVDYNEQEDEFVEILQPAGDELKNYMKQLNVVLPEGFRTEINLQATEWIKEIAESLQKGFVLTVDYGHPSAELYRDSRRNGTLLCYNQHKINEYPYRNIGEQDITAHVNFSALHHWGTRHGLNFCGFTSQAHFLRSLGITDHLRTVEEKSQKISNTEKLFFIHTLLMDMGNKFKVLVQQKGLPHYQGGYSAPVLSGLKFSQQLV